jgi:BlaI family transcriptional regulator, penicillinase repressor
MNRRPPRIETLSRREREIMNVLFELDNRAAVEEIRQRLSQPPTYSAVRAMLAKLEAKGHVRHENDGGRYIYFARTSPVVARRAALQQHLRIFFGGSRNQMLMSLLRQDAWTDEELDRLSDEIERVKSERKS